MKCHTILLILIIILSCTVSAYNKIYQFDENDDIIISTTVYNTTNNKCMNCECNLTIYNPAPNENIINLSTQLINKGNGIYATNITNYNLSYNANIYPLTLICNDTAGVLGSDDRNGIKIGATMFDYTSIMIALIGTAALLFFVGIKLDNQYEELKLISFFSGFAFVIGALFSALEIVKHSPNNSNFIIIYDAMFWAISIVFIAVVYFYAKRRMEKTVQWGIDLNKSKK